MSRLGTAVLRLNGHGSHAVEFRMVREHNSVLAASEKRLLIRMAGRLPAWVNSDHLTVTGAAAMLGIGACFWAGGGALGW